ncbi:helix-turn-helix transcriptional regulator [Sphingobium sp. CAP-1]|uniref:helix-turn-helix transcriptional regulator n=1 Tax=Sphingobium sp. CAP-1 TaxID=2676077 RepID=UPI0012BB45F5|nr:LuxR family transcriptional regulator [Sphingobium sp. CAP-1]QGP80525.1 LuxR family transcriptional regulator [Sphingobium sp. CAP-1]
MSDDAAFVDLLETLFGGLTRSPPWEAFLRALAAATDTTYATMLIGRGCAGIDAHVTPDADPERTQQYRQISEADPFVGLPEGQVVSFSDFVNHIPARFQDWMDVARTGQILGVDLYRKPDISVRLRLTRDDSTRDFGTVEKALLERLIPHLRIALDLHARLTTTQAESQLFSSAMADLAVATLILDRGGRIMRRNAVAARMLEDGAILTEQGGKLDLRTHAAAKTINHILSHPPAAGEESQFEIAMPGGQMLHGRARAVPSSAYGDGAWVALFLADQTRPAGPSGDTLRDRFQLTRSEAALALRLAEGAALADAANELDIAYNTARSHLRAIFAKTGTHRQIQLVTLIRTVGNIQAI